MYICQQIKVKFILKNVFVKTMSVIWDPESVPVSPSDRQFNTAYDRLTRGHLPTRR